ncbi:Nif3-like dinuclear metal center hexameric protein [candidate division KSB1 bacterium]|nr:Nif3-like dinuclear metal center hexameric protein [candidate division KSB1 bacterium]
MNRSELIEEIDNILHPADFEDYGRNGLQVEGKEDIQHIVTGVSCSKRLFQEAVNNQADMILVHHGLFWVNDPRPFTIEGILRERIALLIKNDINLSAYHLPLDFHPEIGNNAMISKRLSLETIGSVDGGALSRPHEPMDIDTFKNEVDKQLETASLLFPFGPRKVSRVFISSGGGAFMYPQALKLNADTFITGEVKEAHVRIFEEEGLNLIVAGHYNTEKLGVQALGKLLSERFKLKTTFIDIPNPV